MTKQLFDYDPLTGVTEWFEADESEGTFTICNSQDVTPLVEHNREIYNQFDSARAVWGDKIGHSTRVASIPLNIYFDLLKRFGRDPVAWKRWLNDPSNRAFRTRPGTV